MSLIRTYLNRNLLKNISTLVLGTGVAQLIAIGFQLITRRLFSPEVFGNYAVYLSLFSILATLSSLQYNRTVLLPKKDKDSIHLVAVSISAIIGINLLILLAVLLFEHQIAGILHIQSEYSFWLLFLPLSVVFFAVYEVLNYWLLRQKAFRISAGTKIIRRSGEGLIQSSMGWKGIPSGLVIGDVAGHFLNALYAGYRSFRRGLHFRSFSRASFLAVAKRYSDFPKYNSIPALLNKLCLFLPVILVNAYYNSEVTGYFDLSRMVLALPLALITQAIMQSLLQSLSESKQKGISIKRHLSGLFALLALMAVMGVFLVVFVGDFIFGLFGAEWSQSALFARIMVYSFALKFVVSPFSAVFTALERIRTASLWQVFNFLVLSVLFFFRELPVMDFILLYVLLEVFSYLVYFVLITRVVHQYERSLYAP